MKLLYALPLLVVASLAQASETKKIGVDFDSNNIEFTNVRYNPKLTPFQSLANKMAEGFGYSAKLHVDDQLAELLRLRVSQLGQCSYCLLTHNREAKAKNIPAEKIDNLVGWRESHLYSDKEKAALAYTESLTSMDLAAFEADNNNVKKYFTELEMAEMAAIVINMNVWTRLKLSQGATPRFKDAH